MSTLRDYLIGRIENAGYTPADIVFIQWDTGIEYLDGTTWVTVPLQNFNDVAGQVQLRDVLPQNRVRIRFFMSDDRVYQYVDDDFIRVDALPRSVTLSASDLTT